MREFTNLVVVTARSTQKADEAGIEQIRRALRGELNELVAYAGLDQTFVWTLSAKLDGEGTSLVFVAQCSPQMADGFYDELVEFFGHIRPRFCLERHDFQLPTPVRP